MENIEELNKKKNNYEFSDGGNIHNNKTITAIRRLYDNCNWFTCNYIKGNKTHFNKLC